MQKPDIFKLARLRGPAEPDDATEAAPLGGTRAQATQRLQVGLFGFAAMVLIVGLANIIQDRARVTKESSVPDAAPTTAPAEAPPQRDPLADAGVVPDLPVDPSAPLGSDPLLETEQNDAAATPDT